MSGRQRESHGIDRSKSTRKAAGKAKPASHKGARKQRAADLGRALRSVYDDTLREAVPTDFMDLLGKLS